MEHPTSYSPVPSFACPIVHTSSRVHAIIAAEFDLPTNRVRPAVELERSLGLDALDRAMLAMALEAAFEPDCPTLNLAHDEPTWITVADVSRSVEARVGRWSSES